MSSQTQQLGSLLLSIEENYENYDVRYDLVLSALLKARELKYKCGFRLDKNEPEWPVIVIELPEIGEVSWHMPPSGIPYDNIPEQNSTRTKKYIESYLS